MIRKLLLGKTRTAHMQFVRYFFVGGSSAVVDLLAYSVMVKVFDIHWAVAAFLGYMLGLAWNHLLCVLWVFESRHSRTKEIFMVFFIAIGGLVLTEVILYILIGFMGMDEVLAKAVSQVLVLFWNFSMRKVYVFH